MRRFNPPPNWPQPPAGWEPAPGWAPDPSWGPLPAGWSLWVDAQERLDKLKIFISYRRSDCQSQANGLHDGLAHRLRYAEIFMDIDSIPAGVDFEDHIRAEIDSCDVVLVLIGDNWLDKRQGSRTRRIDESNDLVRLEIENALGSPDVSTIPVLVEGARMPDPQDLPSSIRRLARINAIELDDMRWKSDLERLARLLDSVHEQRRSGRPLGGLDATRVATVVREQRPSTPAQPARPTASATTPPPPPPPVRSQPAPVISAAPPHSRRSAWASANGHPVVGWTAAFTPLVTCGLTNFVPLLRAGLLRPHQPRTRAALIGIGIALEVLGLASMIVLGSSPQDEEGVATGAQSWIGFMLMFLFAGAAVVLGIIYRKRPPELDAIEGEMVRRRTRDHYRRLALNNPSMARSIHVGRPDVARSVDDAGLVDLNMMGAHALAEHAQIDAREAQRIVEQRAIVGRFVDVEHAIRAAELSDSSASQVRELGVVT